MNTASNSSTNVQDDETITAAADAAKPRTPSAKPKLARWGEQAKPGPPRWIVPGLILAEALNTIGGEPGVGKSRIAAHLAATISAGHPFLGFETEQSPVLVLNFDDPSASLHRQWFEAAAAGLGLSSEDIDRLPTYYLDADQLNDRGLNAYKGLNDHDVFQSIVSMVIDIAKKEGKAPVIIIDAYATAFPMTDNNSGNAVIAANQRLRELQKLRATVVMLDHTPKSLTGQPDHRGVSGSQQKKARARTQHIIRKGAETYLDDQDIVVWTVDKNNAAKVQPPIVIRREYDEAAGTDVMVRTDMPRSTGAPKEDAAYQCIVEMLAASSSWITRKELLNAVKDEVGAGMRTVEAALSAVLENEPVEQQVLSGSGSPKAFRLLVPEDPADFDVTQDLSFDATEVAENTSRPEEDFSDLDADIAESPEDDLSMPELF